MNAAQQMRDIVEKAGECWHIFAKGRIIRKCLFCNVSHKENPSPTDLNELFRLIRKIGYDYSVNTLGGNVDVMIFNKNNEVIGDADADMEHLADALRNALWQAIQEVK